MARHIGIPGRILRRAFDVRKAGREYVKYMLLPLTVIVSGLAVQALWQPIFGSPGHFFGAADSGRIPSAMTTETTIALVGLLVTLYFGALLLMQGFLAWRSVEHRSACRRRSERPVQTSVNWVADDNRMAPRLP